MLIVRDEVAHPVKVAERAQAAAVLAIVVHGAADPAARVVASFGWLNFRKHTSCGAAALCRPDTSMMRLARCSTQPSRELCYSTPLPQPLCDPVRLLCGQEPD